MESFRWDLLLAGLFSGVAWVPFTIWGYNYTIAALVERDEKKERKHLLGD